MFFAALRESFCDVRYACDFLLACSPRLRRPIADMGKKNDSFHATRLLFARPIHGFLATGGGPHKKNLFRSLPLREVHSPLYVVNTFCEYFVRRSAKQSLSQFPLVRTRKSAHCIVTSVIKN